MLCYVMLRYSQNQTCNKRFVWTHQFHEIFVKGLRNLRQPGPTQACARLRTKTAIDPGKALVNSVYKCWQRLLDPWSMLTTMTSAEVARSATMICYS